MMHKLNGNAMFPKNYDKWSQANQITYAYKPGI